MALKSNVPPDVIARWQANKDQAKEVIAKPPGW